jgi:hypothetical protein
MPETKPRLKVVAGRLVALPATPAIKEERPYEGLSAADKRAKATERHGKPFSFEAGGTHRMRDTLLLTEWMQGRGKT